MFIIYLAAFQPSPSIPSIGLNIKSIDATAPTGFGGELSAFNSTNSFESILLSASFAPSKIGIASFNI